MNVWLAEIWRAWRASLRRPGFLLLASGVLALGVGSTVAVFTLIDHVLLRPLPYPQSQQLVAMGWLQHTHVGGVSPQQYQHLSGLSGLQSIGSIKGDTTPANIAGGGPPQQVSAMYVDRGLLPTLGVRLQLGRNFSAEEDAPHGPRAVILGYGFWLSRFGGRADVIGHRLQVEGEPATIVGVLPKDFQLQAGDVMLPTAFPPGSSSDGTNYLAIGRLRPGVTIRAVAAEVDARLRALYADGLAGTDSRARFLAQQHFGAESLQVVLHAQSRPVLGLFLACAVFVLLIALVNLANLMFLRALARGHDVAVRAALGAPRLRLALPALAEGWLVGGVGTLLGLGMAVAGLGALQRFMPDQWLVGGTLKLGAGSWLLGSMLGLFGALTGAAIGVWRQRGAGSIEGLREGVRSGLGVRSGRLGRVLVVVQVALATTLLCAAGLFLHSLYDASRVPMGFDSRGIVTFELAPVKATYTDTPAVQRLARSVLEGLHAQPGVEDATVGTNLPADDWAGQFNLGSMHTPGGERFSAQFRGVEAGFFHLFGIALREGRAFGPGDVRGGEPVAIINRKLADHEYSGHALGKLIQMGDGPQALSARIVGVTENTSQFGPLGPQPPILYLPLPQVPDHILDVFRSFSPLRFALRTQGDPAGYAAAIRAAVARVAPTQPIANVRTMARIVHDTTADTRLILLLVGLFALLALLLAAAGLYAVMAVAVAAREREFGVRSALGASPARLVQLVLRGGLLQIAVGLLLGVGIALGLSSVLRAVLEELGRSTFDPLALAGVCVVLAAAGLLACLIPALRAGRVHPMRGLLGE